MFAQLPCSSSGRALGGVRGPECVAPVHTVLASRVSYAPFRSQQQQVPGRPSIQTKVAVPELAELATTVQSAVEYVSSIAPGPIQPAVEVIGGDIASLVALAPTVPGIARLVVSPYAWQQ